jgi:hypothetical protein
MRHFFMLFACACFVAALLAPGAAYAQPIRPIAAWGHNGSGQINVPSPNEGFYAIAASSQHSLAITADSTIIGWGNNYYGQCNTPSPNADFIAVAAGAAHSLGLKLDGTIIAWGANGDGQCTVPSPNSDFVAIAGGCNHSLGIKSDSTIVAWGANAQGQCDVPSPNADFIAVAAGDVHSLGLKSDGTIVAWGSNNNGQCNIPSPNADFIMVAAGWYHSLGLKSDGTIVAWGRSNHGECSVPSPNANFVGIAGGGDFSLGVKSDGTIVGWGYNAYGQCDVPSPNEGFSAASGGGLHALGLRALPICVVSPTSIDFDTVLVAEYKDTTFTIKNVGYETLVGSVSEACDYYSVVSGEGAYDLDPGDSVVVTVRFEPTAEGPLACEIETGTECSSVSCSGTGLGPVCSVAPLSLDFGFVTIGQHEDLEFALTNTGGGRLTGAVSETCSYFSIVSGEGAYDLGHGDSAYVTVRFEPLTTDAAACTISVGGTCGDVICTGTGDRVPRIYAVRDVPGDQGGFINVAWDAVPGDNPTEHVITRYTVWRAIEPTAAELASLAPGLFIMHVSDLSPTMKNGVVRLELAGSMKYFWKLISSIDAYYIDGYSEVVPTLFDSTAVCTEYHYVQVIAHTGDPYTFWVSPPDSARSVDNLAPGEPLMLAGEQSFSPEGLTLTWKPNVEADLGHYAVYRGTSAGFVPGPLSLIASPPDTAAFDGDWRWSSGYYYKVSAVDVHGNESAYALLAPEEITGDETPRAPAATYISQNFPNPFNPATKIEFGLKEPANVSLRIYDAAGRLVRVLVERSMPAGRYAKVWDGRNAAGRAVASGIYFYRLEAGAFSETKKMVLSR